MRFPHIFYEQINKLPHGKFCSSRYQMLSMIYALCFKITLKWVSLVMMCTFSKATNLGFQFFLHEFTLHFAVFSEYQCIYFSNRSALSRPITSRWIHWQFYFFKNGMNVIRANDWPILNDKIMYSTNYRMRLVEPIVQVYSELKLTHNIIKMLI